VARTFYDRKRRRVRDLSCGDKRVFLDLEGRRVDCVRCGKAKQERLDFLANNPFYTKRFAFYVGRRCRSSTIKDVAQELHLDWHTVKALEKQYMQEQLRRAGTPGPKVLGIDEISIKKRHTYRIVVSEAHLVRRKGSLRGEHGRVLRVAGPQEMQGDSHGRHGHVEAVSNLDPGSCSAGQHPLRQVSRASPPGRSLGYRAQERVRG
jgi:hypothetical protein